MTLMKDTGKFWSFKDTTNYKRTKSINDRKSIVRTFVFDKSFLLQVKKYDGNIYYVMPIRFMSYDFPDGSYVGLSNKLNVHFTDSEIISVVYRE